MTSTDRPTRRGRAGLDRVRLVLARVVRVVCTLAALLLAVGALLVALRHDINADNPVVKAVLRGCDAIDGPFGRDDGVFTFHGAHAAAKDALVNWGIAALVWLAVGRVLDRLIRP